MSTIFATSPGHPFNAAHNKVRNSVSAIWTPVGEGTANLAVNVYGIYYDGASGSALQIRDNEDDIWYAFTSDGGSGIDLFINPLPLYTTFDYYDSTGSNTIIIYGVYV